MVLPNSSSDGEMELASGWTDHILLAETNTLSSG